MSKIRFAKSLGITSAFFFLCATPVVTSAQSSKAASMEGPKAFSPSPANGHRPRILMDRPGTQKPRSERRWVARLVDTRLCAINGPGLPAKSEEPIVEHHTGTHTVKHDPFHA